MLPSSGTPQHTCDKPRRTVDNGRALERHTRPRTTGRLQHTDGIAAGCTCHQPPSRSRTLGSLQRIPGNTLGKNSYFLYQASKLHSKDIRRRNFGKPRCTFDTTDSEPSDSSFEFGMTYHLQPRGYALANRIPNGGISRIFKRSGSSSSSVLPYSR